MGGLRGRRLLRLAGRHMLGVDPDAELQVLTQVLTAAGYEVAADSDHNIACSVIACLAPRADPTGWPVGIRRFPDTPPTRLPAARKIRLRGIKHRSW